MLSFYWKCCNVEYWLGLELDRCYCRKNSDGFFYDWRYIYDCYRIVVVKVGGFVELCFFCNEWFCGIGVWEIYC